MGRARAKYFAVMAGLDPAIHVFLRCGAVRKDVDTRDKRGHDGVWNVRLA